MIEKTIDKFIERIKEIVITDPNMKSIPLAYLMTLDIPDAIKHYFDQEVEIWLREEENKFTTTERFDYDVPQVRMLIDQVFDHLKQSATFHINKFNQLLERAIKLEMNYLLEPHRTLTQFIFKDSNIVPTMEIYDTLKYFFRLEYYKNAISDYFNTKYMREIKKGQFVELLKQIDEQAFSEKPAETALKVIKSIMGFLGEAQDTEVNSLPIELLQTAFKDRNLKDYQDLLKKADKESGLSELTFDELETMLRDGSIPGGEQDIKDKTEIIGIKDHDDIETSKPEVSVAEIEVPEIPLDESVVGEDIEEDIEEDFEDEEYELEDEEEYEEEMEEADVAIEVEAPEEESVEEEVVEEEFAEEEPLEEAAAEPEITEEQPKTAANVAQDLADHVARQISSDTPLEDINSLIKGRTRRKILKKLFKKKENEFLLFIEQINKLATWKEASRIIDDEFYTREINPYSSEAITFSDIIYTRFFPKDKYVTTESETNGFG
ncbi:MAG: hypothetical protein JW956_07590 [Calditrichaceae bacterium]|nr:hypothetical protein [Calditrichaceae bacterium]